MANVAYMIYKGNTTGSSTDHVATNERLLSADGVRMMNERILPVKPARRKYDDDEDSVGPPQAKTSSLHQNKQSISSSLYCLDSRSSMSSSGTKKMIRRTSCISLGDPFPPPTGMRELIQEVSGLMKDLLLDCNDEPTTNDVNNSKRIHDETSIVPGGTYQQHIATPCQHQRQRRGSSFGDTAAPAVDRALYTALDVLMLEEAVHSIAPNSLRSSLVISPDMCAPSRSPILTTPTPRKAKIVDLSSSPVEVECHPLFPEPVKVQHEAYDCIQHGRWISHYPYSQPPALPSPPRHRQPARKRNMPHDPIVGRRGSYNTHETMLSDLTLEVDASTTFLHVEPEPPLQTGVDPQHSQYQTRQEQQEMPDSVGSTTGPFCTDGDDDGRRILPLPTSPDENANPLQGNSISAKNDADESIYSILVSPRTSPPRIFSTPQSPQHDSNPLLFPHGLEFSSRSSSASTLDDPPEESVRLAVAQCDVVSIGESLLTKSLSIRSTGTHLSRHVKLTPKLITYIVGGVESTNHGTFSGSVNATGEMHGNGVFWFNSGDVYLGQFEHDNLHGIGALSVVDTCGEKVSFQGYFRENEYIGEAPRDPLRSIHNL